MMRSQLSASSQPPPRANPRTAAISGVRIGADPVPDGEPVVDEEADRRLAGQLHDVGTGREGPRPAAGQHDRPALRIGVERGEGVGELVEQVEAQGVEDLGAIDRDERDAVDRAGRARVRGTRR